MDTPALAIGFIVVMAVIAFGGALGGTTLVYVLDQRRKHAPRAQGEDQVRTSVFGDEPETSESAATGAATASAAAAESEERRAA